MADSRTVRISPSLASAPSGRLAQVVQELEAAGADMIHFDVEDGVFVPAMTLGTRMIGELRPLTRLPFDVHLMMVNPEWIVPQLARDGADRIAVHYEACPYPRRTLRLIAEAGVQAGLAFNPATPLPDLRYLRPYLSFVLILTSEPELPAAAYLADVLHKLERARGLAGLEGLEWAADGGLNAENLPDAVRAGADTLVVGRAIFQGEQIAANVARLRAALGSLQSRG